MLKIKFRAIFGANQPILSIFYKKLFTLIPFLANLKKEGGEFLQIGLLFFLQIKILKIGQKTLALFLNSPFM